MNNLQDKIIQAIISNAYINHGSALFADRAAKEIMQIIQQERVKAQEEVVNGLTLDLIVIAKSIPPEQVVSEIAIKLKELKQSLAEKGGK